MASIDHPKKISKEDSKDFIIFESAITKNLNANQWTIIKEHNKIMSVLRDGLKTVKEIHNEFYDVQKKKHNFTINTLYRHLKKLEDVDLIAVAGHRIIEGERSPERLYARTSKIYFPQDYENAYGDWIQKEGIENIIKVADILAEALKKDKGDLLIDHQSFTTLFHEYSKLEFTSWKELIENTSGNKKLEMIFQDVTFSKINEINRYVSMFMVFIKHPKIFQDIAKLFDR